MFKMEYEITPTSSPGSLSPNSSISPSSSPSPPPLPTQVVISPCAACKILRRRCADKCVLAPYFPPTEPAKFTIAHRVFGASNITKLLQELPESQRAHAVSSMVYEANARIRDPVYGCAGAICQLQKQINELQAQLAKARAEVTNMQLQQANLAAVLCMEMAQSTSPQPSSQQSMDISLNPSLMEDNNNFGSLWEPLWA
ncbi:LOB domain-containing protein 11 [Hibiscus syriacus]|uniref:LOB domain-containing protein 11 n=1 Tax=Hibiscus syriacus TaxID=106335 RepID=A0A6A2YWG9_HIBSY|nr:LOB domain-containing protein 1-like [Hibiscus syriacus]KAE8683660.1 LOB domain-containing protein 11 [Hibiscus syriacus]